MSFLGNLFSAFSTAPAQAAAGAQISGLGQGYGLASGNLQQAIQALTSNFQPALQGLTSNYQAALPGWQSVLNTGQAGVNQLQNALGFGGPGGTSSALQTLQSTPGYQFQQQQGNNAITAANAAAGTTGSGNEALALSNYNQGLAGTTYNNYVNQLQPFLNQQQAGAGGIGNVYQGLGQGTANLYTGLGSSLAGQYGNLANLGWNYGTGVGNANANADLAAYTASANELGALGGLLGGGAKLGVSGGGTLGGNALSGLGSGFMGLFSDADLKENIQKVGELTDGQPVFSYNYKGDWTPRLGLIAQEVEKVRPDAVREFGGFKAVDYRLATEFSSKLERFLEAA